MNDQNIDSQQFLKKLHENIRCINNFIEEMQNTAYMKIEPLGGATAQRRQLIVEV